MPSIAKNVLLTLNKFPALRKKIAGWAAAVQRVNENSNYDENTNGERWVLQKLAAAQRLDTCFDVGANRGHWAALALAANAGVKVHCFEACKPTYERLAARFAQEGRVVQNAFGLSNRTGEITIKYCEANDGLSSVYDLAIAHPVELIPAKLTRGDAYCTERGVAKIDFLKVDVEGAEHLVMEGFGTLLNPQQVPVIQFEYGLINISTKFLLLDFYTLLESKGYRVGKLFPNFVRFRSYRFQDEDFIGPNFIAASPEVANLLSEA